MHNCRGIKVLVSFNEGLLVATCKCNKLVFLASAVAHWLPELNTLVYQLCSTALNVFLMTIVQAPTTNNVSPHLTVETRSVKSKEGGWSKSAWSGTGHGVCDLSCGSNKSINHQSTLIYEALNLIKRHLPVFCTITVETNSSIPQEQARCDRVREKNVWLPTVF